MTNRELLKEAIADAKAVKEVAIANAKAVLVETFTPHLESMYRKTLAEIEDDEYSMKEMYSEEDDVQKEEMDLEEILRELEKAEMEENVLNEAEGEEDEEEDEEEEEEEEEDESEEEGEEEDVEIDFDNMTEDDLKKFIEEVVDEMIEAGEIEGGHSGMGQEMGGKDSEKMQMSMDDIDTGIGSEEELMEDETEVAPAPSRVKPGTKTKPRRPITPTRTFPKTRPKAQTESNYGLRADLQEALQTVKKLQNELTEVNLLNSKLLYTSKILREKNLSEAQKVQVLAAFDKAVTAKEAKLVYETLKEGLTKSAVLNNKRDFLKESKSSASKPITTSRKQPVVEVSPMVQRFQELAGLI